MLPSIVNYLPCICYKYSICPLHPVHIRTDWAPLNDVMGQIWPADLGFDTWFKRHDHVLVCHNHTELCVCIQSTILILKEEVKTEQKHLTTSWINLSLCCHCFLKNMSLGNSGNDSASRFSSVTVVSAHTHTHTNAYALFWVLFLFILEQNSRFWQVERDDVYPWGKN